MEEIKNTSLEEIANTPRTFTLNNKTYKVRLFNLLELSEIRQAIIDNIRKQYKKDIAELATSIDSKERSRFIIDAVKAQNIDEEMIKDYMMSRDGIYKILSIALKESIEKVIELLNNPETQDIMIEIFKHALGINDDMENEEKKT